jgi:hypothetical protein
MIALLMLLAQEGYRRPQALDRAEPDVQVGGAYRFWLGSVSGSVRADELAVPGTTVELTADLDVSQNEAYNDFAVCLETPLGNVRLDRWYGGSEGSERLDSTITFQGASYSAGSLVDSDVSIQMATLVYEYPIAGWLGLQGGLRYASATAELESATISEEGDLLAVVPMLGARVWREFSRMFRGELEVGGLAMATGDGAARFIDVRAEIAVTPWRGVLAGIGWRWVAVYLKDESESDKESVTDLTLGGLYFTIGVQF